MVEYSNIELLINSICPNGINKMSLKEVCKIINGYAFKSANYVTEGIRVIRISDVQRGSIANKDIKYYPSELQDEYKSYLLKESDIVMSLTGNCGRVAMITEKVLPAALNQRVACLRSSNHVISRYLFHILNSSKFENDAMESAHGAGQKNLSTSWLGEYKIPIPPIAVQEAIVSILDSFANLVSNIDEEIKARQIQYDNVSALIMDSKKQKWAADTFLNLGKMYSGLGGKTKADFSDGNAKYVTYKNVYSNPAIDIDIEDTVKVGPEERQNTIQYGDAIFTGSSETPDECAISSVVNQHVTEKIYLNSFCFGFRFNDLSDIHIDFYKHYFRSAEMRVYAKGAANGTTRFNVSKALFERIQIPLPPLAEQRAIAEKLDTIEAFINNLKTERDLRQQQYEYYREYLINLLK